MVVDDEFAVPVVAVVVRDELDEIFCHSFGDAARCVSTRTGFD